MATQQPFATRKTLVTAHIAVQIAQQQREPVLPRHILMFKVACRRVLPLRRMQVNVRRSVVAAQQRVQQAQRATAPLSATLKASLMTETAVVVLSNVAIILMVKATISLELPALTAMLKTLRQQ